jgi:hypothetical protein
VEKKRRAPEVLEMNQIAAIAGLFAVPFLHGGANGFQESRQIIWSEAGPILANHAVDRGRGRVTAAGEFSHRQAVLHKVSPNDFLSVPPWQGQCRCGPLDLLKYCLVP